MKGFVWSKAWRWWFGSGRLQFGGYTPTTIVTFLSILMSPHMLIRRSGCFVLSHVTFFSVIWTNVLPPQRGAWCNEVDNSKWCTNLTNGVSKVAIAQYTEAE
jgi:hypothetical protein